MASPRLKDYELDAELDRRGYVTLRLFAPDEAAAIRERLLESTEERTAANHSAIYISAFDADEGRKQALEDAAKTLLSAALAPHLLAGRIQNGGAVVKDPGGGLLAMHHHPPVTEAYPAREIICWCPLTDVDEHSGALRVVPGSHNLLPFIRLPKTPDYFGGFREKVERHGVAVPLKAGEAILFENTILHGSAPNEGPVPRYAIVGQIVPEDATNALYLEGDDGLIDIVEAPTAEAFRQFVQTGVRPPEWRTVKRIANPNRPIEEAEFERLIGFEPQTPNSSINQPAEAGVLRKFSSKLRSWF